MKVCIIPDSPNWSCDFTSEYIIQHVPKIDFIKRYAVDYMRGTAETLVAEKPDVAWVMLHHRWWDIFRQVREEVPDIKMILGIRGINGLKVAKQLRLEEVDIIGVQSKWAYDYLLEQVDHTNVWITRDGVDESFFRPILDVRPKPEEFIVGWAGQPRLAVKRYDMIKEICRPFETRFAVCNPMAGQIAFPHSEMPMYYNSLSCFFHFSEGEGAPRPVIEAAACGIPVVTSPTGYGQEIINPRWHVHSEEQAQNFLYSLRHDYKLRKRMGHENRKIIEESWTWKKRAPEYERFFRQEGEPITT